MLKALMLRKKIDLKLKERAKLEEAAKDLEKREAELAQSVEEVETEEEQTAVQESIDSLAEEREQLAKDTSELEENIRSLENELQELESKQEPAPEQAAGSDPIERSVIPMTRSFFGMSPDQIRSFLADEKVAGFLTEVRSAIREKRAISNVGLLIPDTMLGLVREEIYRKSKLLRFVDLRPVGGTARMNIMGKIPEAIWTEMCANINEIDLMFNQAEVDGYKVSAAVVVCNAILEDADIALATEIVNAIATAIAKAVDKAILFGTGTKMPIGIATRLAQTSAPAWWGTNEPAFTDLHTTNVVKLDIKASSGAAFFMAMVEKLGIAKPKYSGDGLFWVMNRKTHMDIMAKALAFNANAALVSNTNIFPVVGGEVVELEDVNLADYEIMGGFGGNYLMVERAGIQLASSKEYRFLEDQTAFKGTARYDGRPLCGEAFVIVNYNNENPTTSESFPEDEANSVDYINLTSTASVAVGGTIKLKAKTAPGRGAITWTSAATAKATVDENGVVTGVASGSSVITATSNGKTASCTVTVTA